MRNLFLIFSAIFLKTNLSFAQNEIENCDSVIETSSNFIENYNAVTHNDSESLFYIFLLIAFFYGISNWLFPHFFKSLHQSFFNSREQSKFVKNQLNGYSLAFYIVKIFNSVTQAITVYLLYNYFNKLYFNDNLDFLFSLILCFIIFQIVKEVVNGLLAYTFNSVNLIKTHCFNALINKTFLSYFLIIIALIFALSSLEIQQYLFYLIVIVVLISLGIEFAKALYSALNKGIYSKFKFFIYLCTLEILPLVIFYKIINNWM